jgi:sulfatase modifying factor 1
MRGFVLLAVLCAAACRPSRAAFRDCADCPEMVVIPAGVFAMGSPDDEPGRGADEGPRHTVRLERPFALGRFEVTRLEYEAFLAATHRPVGGDCITDRRQPGDWKPDAETTLRDPGFQQAPTHPVVCVSWSDAKAYADWLAQKTGKPYRLAREAEWEYAARAGSSTAYPWGDDAAQGCPYMNGTDATARKKYAALPYAGDFGACDDHQLNTAPVGSFRASAFGLFDMIGNVGEWVEDCSTPSYAARAPEAPGACARRVVRGGSWGTIARQLRSAERVNQPPTDRDDSIGIRVARDL